MNPVIDNLAEDIFIDDCTEFIPEEPLRNIALMFSGGGFRAACFSLGALTYLHRIQYKDKPVLESVKFITSTSGGSITNGFYSVSLYRKQFDFISFYNQLRLEMDGETLLGTVFSILENPGAWKEKGELTNADGTITEIKKPRNPINAFAKAYDKHLFGEATLATIADSKEIKPHLEEVCFNSTEFNNGMNFYFQVSGHEHKVFPRGNGYLKFGDFATARKLKISDIVAASSCFPAGFEPIIYPNDFVHSGCNNINEMLSGIRYRHNDPLALPAVENKPFGLMDGGIADNMGIHNVMIEDSERRQAGKGQFDLILSCDVTSYFNDPLEQVAAPPTGITNHISIQGIINVFKFSILLFLLSIASIITKTFAVAGYLLLIPSGLFGLVYLIGFSRLNRLKKNAGGDFALALRYLHYFLKLPLSAIIAMIRQRLSSSLKLVSSLFLKQIRRGQYEHLFSKPVMRHRAISCLIYEFSSSHEERRVKNLAARDAAWWPGMKNVLMPGEKIQTMVNKARSMGTTLWFGDKDRDKKDMVIATGQLTTCYSLIKHICRLETLDKKYTTDNDVQDLKKRLLNDWQKFKGNPFFMINNLQA